MAAAVVCSTLAAAFSALAAASLALVAASVAETPGGGACDDEASEAAGSDSAGAGIPEDGCQTLSLIHIFTAAM